MTPDNYSQQNLPDFGRSTDFARTEDERQSFQPVSGAGKTLGLFLGIVLIAAVTFAVGYRLGKRAGGEAPVISGPTAAAAGNIPKPSAASDMAAPALSSASSATSPAASPATQPAGASDSSSASSPEQQTAAPEFNHSSPSTPAGNFAVQVAAVSKEEDADALVAALRQKNYPVFVVSNQSGDKFFHVQVGPFATLNEADAMRARLAGDGYNPIVKK